MASPCGAVIDVFQSTPSVGRATGQCIKPHLRQSISIHALRGEGDGDRYGQRNNRRNFNPRPPWGGRPKTEETSEENQRFQSTPSVGRATALPSRKKKLAEFQSTPSVGRATVWSLAVLPSSVISIHVLRGEGDFAVFNLLYIYGGFQSTPSVGRATIVKLLTKKVSSVISIHALRGEGDEIVQGYRFPNIIISIHALRGEGDNYMSYAQMPSKFISIHALRGEGDFKDSAGKLKDAISIHALRGEGDQKDKNRLRRS